jgi:hypothetical protein
MDQKPGWIVDVKSCSSERLVELLEQLEGSQHNSQVLAIQCELIERARKSGRTNQQLIDGLTRRLTTKRERAKMAQKWSVALGISEEEFKRMAG